VTASAAGRPSRWVVGLLAATVRGCCAALIVVLPLAASRGPVRMPAAGGSAAPGALLLAAIALVALLAHLGGLVARICGQPSVVGQIAAGVLLGPSVLGRVVPALSGDLLGPPSLGHLQALAELGVTFFVLQVGYELASRRTRTAPAGSWEHLYQHEDVDDPSEARLLDSLAPCPQLATWLSSAHPCAARVARRSFDVMMAAQYSSLLRRWVDVHGHVDDGAIAALRREQLASV
jgi:hypothetical protein